MAKSYVQPTLADFTKLLEGQSFSPLTLAGTREIVLGKRVDIDGIPLSLRIYTSLEPSGEGRECGEDAIRVEVYAKDSEGQIKRIGGSKRVNRVAGWQERLLQRVQAWKDQLGPACPCCGGPTVLRKGRYGEFHGCYNYPHCKGIINIQKK